MPKPDKPSKPDIDAKPSVPIDKDKDKEKEKKDKEKEKIKNAKKLESVDISAVGNMTAGTYVAEFETGRIRKNTLRTA